MPTITKTISSTQRQGSYGGTRYHGKYNFGATGLDLETMNVDSATLALDATASGKSGARRLWLRHGTGTSEENLLVNNLGEDFYVNRDITNILQLSTEQEQTLEALKTGSFSMYVSSKDDDHYYTDSTGNKYSSHYTKFSKATLTINWSYKNGTLNLSETNVNIGEEGDSITATISNYISDYYYKIKVIIGDYTKEYELGNKSSETLEFSDQTYIDWINDKNHYLFKNAKSLTGAIVLTTYSDSDYSNKLGDDSSIPVSFWAKNLIPPTIIQKDEKITYNNIEPYSSITTFSIPGKSSIFANFSETTSQGATIVKRTITTNFSSNNSFSSNEQAVCKPDLSVGKGDSYYITITITDSRGDIASTTFEKLNIQPYNPPTIKIIPTRQLIGGKQQLKVEYSIDLFEGAGLDSVSLSLKDSSNNTIIESTDITPSPYITQIDGGISELEHFISITVKDTFGGEKTEQATLPSESFYLHFGTFMDEEGEGISLGIGGAAPTIKNLVRCYWDLELKSPLKIEQGGTGIGLTASPSMLVNLGSTSKDQVFKAEPRPGVEGKLGIANGGTGADNASLALQNLGITSGTDDLIDGVSPLTTGTYYFVYEEGE